MPARFQVGDTVQVKVRGPEGYNRTPIYLRGKNGTIHEIHGDSSTRAGSATARLRTIRRCTPSPST